MIFARRLHKYCLHTTLRKSERELSAIADVLSPRPGKTPKNETATLRQPGRRPISEDE
jgi:hypothetical protein